MTGHRSEPLLKLEHPILFTGEWAFSELYVEYRGKEGNFADSSRISPGANFKENTRIIVSTIVKFGTQATPHSKIPNVQFT